VKIFPCSSVGGPAYIKALHTVLPHIPMIPTGGVNLSNAGAFLRAGAAAIGVGSELTSVPSITETAQQFLLAVETARQELSRTDVRDADAGYSESHD
jgi:2-dehydro-3-deoxyphosphogluconate aldolase/(4S)-4-hydroxy-2-oxoglutarate aldolase